MSAVRVGVIGVGHLGRIHARIYSELPGAELAGVVDSVEEAARETGRLYGVPAYRDAARFMDEVRPDAVSIVVPTVCHYDVAMAAASRGIPMLIEKPVTSSSVQARELLKAVSAQSLPVQVGHVERFNSAVRYLAGHMEGTPLCFQFRRQGPASARIGDVGVVLDLMIHDIDILLSLVRSPIVSLSALGRSAVSRHEDIAFAQLLFENGVMASLQASRASSKRLRVMEATTTEACYTVNYELQDLTIQRAPQGGKEYVEHPLLPRPEPLKQELSDFLSCLTEGRRPMVDLEAGLRALETAEMVLSRMKELS